jgi:hypothetical protein
MSVLRKKNIHSFLIFLFLFCHYLFSQKDTVFYWKSDTQKIRIGEWVHLQLYFHCPKGEGKFWTWPDFSDTLTSKVEIISKSPVEQKQNAKYDVFTQTLTISAYDSGYFAIPPVFLRNTNDSTRSLLTDALLLEVHTVPTDSLLTKTKDIKPEFQYPFKWSWYKEYAYWGLGILLTLAIVIAVWYYLIKKRKPETSKPVILEPPHVIALRELEKIKNESVWKQGKVKDYYSSVSDVLRAYIERRYSFPALESTTDEIMKVIRTRVITNEQKENLQQILQLSDLVKFAKWNPVPSENELIVEKSIEFVRQTMQDTPPAQHPATA